MQATKMVSGSRIWVAWAGVIVRWPRSVMAVCLIVSGTFGIIAALSPRDLSLTGMLGDEDPEVVAFTEVDRIFGGDSLVVLFLEGEPEDVRLATSAVINGLTERFPAVEVIGPADPQWMIDRGPWLWPEDVFNATVQAVSGGAEGAAIDAQLTTIDNFIRDAVQPTGRAALLRLDLPGDSLDAMGQAISIVEIMPVVEEILAELDLPVTARYTGAMMMFLESGDLLLKRLAIITPCTLVVIMVLLLTIEPRLLRMIAAGASLGMSVVFALGFVGAVTGEISIMSSVFAMILLGLTVDFAIHLLVALRDAESHGLEPEQAVRQAIDYTGTAITLGAVSSGLAFAVLLFIPDKSANDVGLTGLVGLVAGLVFMLSFLPASWLLIERRRIRKGKHNDPSARLTLPGLASLVRISMSHPRSLIAAGVGLAIVGLAGIQRYELEGDSDKLISRDVPSVQLALDIAELYGAGMTPFIAPVDSIEEARRLARKLIAIPEVAQVSSVADYVLENINERSTRVAAALAETDVANEYVAALRGRLARAMEVGPITPEQIPLQYAAGIIGKDGEFALRIIPAKDETHADAIGSQISAIREVAPTATGMPVLARIAIIGNFDFTVVIIPSIFGVVTFVLIIALRNRRDVLLALVPVSIGTAITFGICFWFGMQFDRLTSFIVPVILGLGVDDGIHVVERLRRYRVRSAENIFASVESVGRPIFLTTATTTLSFAGLLFSNHYSMEALAKFMLIGVPVCFLTSVTIVPALSLLVDRGIDPSPNDTS